MGNEGVGETTSITADVGHGAWVVRVCGPLDSAAVARLTFTLSRLMGLGSNDLVVDLRRAEGSAEEVLAQAAARAAAAGLGFATVAPDEADERPALLRARMRSHRRHGRTALTPEEVRTAA